MSHFTVLVVGEDPEGQLAPFQENNMADCPQEYLGFDDIEDAARQEYENGSSGGKPHKETYSTFESFMQEWHGLKERDPQTGRYGFWCNPNAKWDWYVLGGRWTGFFKLKEGAEDFVAGRPGLNTEAAQPGFADSCRIKDIDIEGTKKAAYLQAAKDWDNIMRGNHTAETLMGIFGITPHTSKEEYCRKAELAALQTFAILLDGEWFERGDMGWWGIVSNEKPRDAWSEQFGKLFGSLPPETRVSVYDCHI